jgi:hypothetical protein
MKFPSAVDGVLFVCWLALGAAIEMLVSDFGLYRFAHWTIPIVTAVVLFGFAATFLQRRLGQRPLLFALSLYGLFVAMEFVNTAGLEWWTVDQWIRVHVPGQLPLALITSAPLFAVAYAMSLSFRPLLGSAETPAQLPPDIRIPAIDRRVVAFGAICVVLFVAFGTYGNSDYLLRPFGVGNLVSVAPLELRTDPRLDAGAAVLIFAFQAAVILVAAFVACRICSLNAATFGFGRGNIPARIGVPLLVLLTVVPLPGFIHTGFDPIAGTNFPFVPLDSLQAFIGYELAYFLFFFKVEVLFRSFLFLGMAAVMTPAPSNDAEPGTDALVIAGTLSCLCYIVFHLGKPLPELIGSIIWGPLACVIIWWTRSVFYLVVPHWLWNLVLDGVATLQQHGVPPS